MAEQVASRVRQTEQEGADDPDNLLFPDDSEKDRIVEYSPQERFYRFNEEIGFGSYKSVYRGHDSDTGRQIAWNVIKLMRLPPQERKRLTEQIYILRNISHKKIISFINAWLNKNKNEMIFITEMVSGGSLKKHLRKIKKPRLKIIKGWCRQILEGLNYLHNQKPSPIIHRDIKCENIFINTNTNEIRIGDLGLAIFTRDSYAETLIGTPEFMAPEIFEGKYSTGVDIYAFGMCVLEMATLETPYQECKGLPQIYKHIEQRIKPKSLELIQCDSLRNFISKCLNDSKDRPSASELLEDEFFLPDEQDKKEVQLRPSHSIIQEVSPELQSTLKKQYYNHSLTPTEHIEQDIQDVLLRHSQIQPPVHAVSLCQNPLTNSADIGQIQIDSLKRMPSNDPMEKSSGVQSPNSTTLLKVKEQVTAEFKEMFQAYRKKIIGQVQEAGFTNSLNLFEQGLLKEVQQSGSSPAANVSVMEKSINNDPKPVAEKDLYRKVPRQNSSEKLNKKAANELETKSMMEVNQNGKKTPSSAYKWADHDFDFISPQNQPSSSKVNHAYSEHQNKHSSSKNINIPTSTPPPPTKNATKLAEIANKIKVELPKPNSQPLKDDEIKNKSEQAIKTLEATTKASTEIAKYKQQLYQGQPASFLNGTNNSMQPFDLQRQLAEKASNKNSKKNSPKSTEPGNPSQSKPTLQPPAQPRQSTEQRNSLQPETHNQPDIPIDKKNILSMLTKTKSIAHQTFQSNPQVTTSGLRSPQTYIVPGLMSSAPTSPTPTIQQVLASTTPVSPQPNIQQNQVIINVQVQSHQQTATSQHNIPVVQPFSQAPQQNASLGSPVHLDPILQPQQHPISLQPVVSQPSSQPLEKSESVKTSPQTIDLLSGSLSPKQEEKPMNIKNLQRARTEQYQAESVLLSQARKKHKEGIKFPISKQTSSKEEVMMLQNILSKLMDEKLEAIGVFGHYTQQLVKRFQQNNKLKVDGMVDHNMYTLMLGTNFAYSEQLQKSSKQADKQRQLSEKEQRQRQQTNELSRKLMSQMEAEVLKKE